MKTVVFTFGRFQPPTIGHEKLINKVVSTARRVKGDARLYTSHSQDSKSNPIPYEVKLKVLKSMFPGVDVVNTSAKHMYDVILEFVREGYRNVYLVVGSDRINDFQEVKKYIKHPNEPGYDPSKHLDIDTFKVVSAGKRNPNDTGVAGMSGTKVRQLALAGDFSTFKKAIPKTTLMNAQLLYNTIRRNLKEETTLTEGVHDPAIFKAVFFAGAPGSGKDYIMKHTVQGLGLKELNIDIAFEFLIKKKGLSMLMPDSESYERELVRDRARKVRNVQRRNYYEGRLGIIFNSTGAEFEKTKNLKDAIEELGYETLMIFVNVDNETARARNVKRGQLGGRTVPERIRNDMWNQVTRNIGKYQNIFKDRFYIIDNSKDAGSDSQELDDNILRIHREVRKFVNKPPRKKEATQWIKDQGKMVKENKTETDLMFESYLEGTFGQKSEPRKNTKYKKKKQVSTEDNSNVTYNFMNSTELDDRVRGVGFLSLGENKQQRKK